MPSFRWTLFDPVDAETITLDLNPREGGTPDNGRNLTHMGTTAGHPIVFEGQPEPEKWSVTGTVLTAAHYDQIVAWWGGRDSNGVRVEGKRHQIQVTDDLGRSLWIYPEKATWRRKSSQTHPWRNEYTLDAAILDVPS